MTHSTIKSVTKLGEKLFEVEMIVNKTQVEKIEVNTILMAIGRDPNPHSYNASGAEIEIDKNS